MRLTATHKIGFVAGIIYLTDQLTKLAVIRLLDYADHYDVVPGFFKFVHWGNTGAAFSMFHGNNGLLALVSLLAIVMLVLGRRHFEVDKPLGQIATGLILGGILGNLTDRLRVGHVIDFIYFHLRQRGGEEIGFPAFNVADSAICVGVGLLFLLSFTRQPTRPPPPSPPA